MTSLRRGYGTRLDDNRSAHNTPVKVITDALADMRPIAVEETLAAL